MARVGVLVVAIAFLTVSAGAQATRAGRAPKPTVGPIIAQRVLSPHVTYYAIQASEPKGADRGALSIAWSLTPPANDKSCKSFGREPDSAKVAVWKHDTQDGCSHAHIGQAGHLGIVKAVVRGASWVCTATYLGTDTGFGKYPVCVPTR